MLPVSLPLGLSLVLPSSAQPSAAPDAVEIRLREVEASLEKGDYEHARDELAAAEREIGPKDPRIVRVHERRGASYLREDRFKEARDAFTRAIQAAGVLKLSDPVLARAYAGMGLCLLKQGNKAYALKFFKRGLGAKPDEGTLMFLEDQVRELEGGAPEPLR